MPHARPDQPELTVLNPLPTALHHYESALLPSLSGARFVRVRRVSIESSGKGRAGEAGAKMIAVLRLASHGIRSEDLLILWPTFGLAEAFFWRILPGRGQRIVVIHDPVPLRQQVGHSRAARVLGRWGARGRRVQLVTHTQLARQALESAGLPVCAVIRHPVRPDENVRSSHERDAILVAGQFKSARDTSILKEIHDVADHGSNLRIVGRGWPEIPGWNVDSRFLDEDELEEAIASAAVVLVPYKHYFQSGIATRAFELGVPVVANRHEFIESLYGAAWPGFSDGETGQAWWDAILRARDSHTPPASEHIASNKEEWADFFHAQMPIEKSPKSTFRPDGEPDK